MKKSELKDGMIVEFRDGEKGVVLGGIIRFKKTILRLEVMDDNMTCRLENKSSIDKVYEVGEYFTLLDFVFESCLNLIWERKKGIEIDWTKVPKGTMIKVKDYEGNAWSDREFITVLDETYRERFICKNNIDEGLVTNWRFATIDNPKQEWLK